MTLWKICLFQTFGHEPTDAELNPVVDVVWPNFANGKLGHLRIANMIKRGFTGGDETKFHALYPFAVDTDLMFLASKMRAAASRGELDRLEIDPALAARKDEFIAMQARQAQDMDAFFTRITEQLRGKQVFMPSTYHQMYDIAKAGLERGVRNVFAPDSAILTGGGMKGVALPDDFMDVIKDFLGVDRIQVGYGFSESSTFHWACSEGRYHVAPWVIPFVLDPDTSEPLPRTGVPDRPRRRLRHPAARPLGRRHLRRRSHHRLGPAVPVRTVPASPSNPASSATARSRALKTTGSPAPQRMKYTTRP